MSEPKLNIKELKKLLEAEFYSETNISILFFTKKNVYKLKKSVDLGFINASKCAERLRLTRHEYKINKKISPKIYLELLPVRLHKGSLSLGRSGKLLECLIKMKRLPDEGWLPVLLEKNKVSRLLVLKMASRMAGIHKTFKPRSPDKKFGSKNVIDKNWKLVINLLKKYAQNTFLSSSQLSRLEQKVDSDIKKLGPLFKQRVVNKKIQRVHGDLHAENIFIENNEPYIIDVIVPVKQWEYGDVARDVGALAMDLEAYGQTKLSGTLVDEYLKKKKDESLWDVLSFYKLYWAAIRLYVNAVLYKSNVSGSYKKANRYKKIVLNYLKAT